MTNVIFLFEDGSIHKHNTIITLPIANITRKEFKEFCRRTIKSGGQELFNYMCEIENHTKEMCWRVFFQSSSDSVS